LYGVSVWLYEDWNGVWSTPGRLKSDCESDLLKQMSTLNRTKEYRLKTRHRSEGRLRAPVLVQRLYDQHPVDPNVCMTQPYVGISDHLEWKSTQNIFVRILCSILYYEIVSSK